MLLTSAAALLHYYNNNTLLTRQLGQNYTYINYVIKYAVKLVNCVKFIFAFTTSNDFLVVTRCLVQLVEKHKNPLDGLDELVKEHSLSVAMEID